MGLRDVKLFLYTYDSWSFAACQLVRHVGGNMVIMQTPAISLWPQCEFKQLVLPIIQSLKIHVKMAHLNIFIIY